MVPSTTAGELFHSPHKYVEIMLSSEPFDGSHDFRHIKRVVEHAEDL